MKLLTTLFLIIFMNLGLMAQDNKSGQITYEQIKVYDFNVYQDDARWAAYIADLPKEGRLKYVLTFNKDQSIYELDESDQAPLSRELQGALGKANYAKGPQTKTKQTFFNAAQLEKIEMVEFMTRNFLVKSDMPAIAWKLTSERKKILDYVCLGAEMEKDGVTYTAWFSAQIPISAGPSTFNGLPGLILGVEKDNEIFVLATAVDLSPIGDNLQSKLKDGKQLSDTDFEQTVVEKIKEFKASKKNKTGAKKLTGKG